MICRIEVFLKYLELQMFYFKTNLFTLFANFRMHLYRVVFEYLFTVFGIIHSIVLEQFEVILYSSTMFIVQFQFGCYNETSSQDSCREKSCTVLQTLYK